MGDGALPRAGGSTDPANVPFCWIIDPAHDLLYDVAAGAFLTERPVGTIEAGLGIESKFLTSR